MIAHSPLHRSGRAGLPHPAPTLGDNAYAAQRIRMIDHHRRQPVRDKAPHAIPAEATVLAAPRQRAMPEPAYPVPEQMQSRLVHGHAVIPDVSTYHRRQPLALFGDGVMHAPLQLDFHRIELGLQPLANRLPQHGVHSVVPLLHADVRKAEEVERLRLPFSAPLPVLDCIRSKLQQPRLDGMQFKIELAHSLREFVPKLLSISFGLEPNHESSRPGELHPQALTDSGLERLRSSGSYRPVAALRSNGQ